MKSLSEALFSRRNLSNLKIYHISDIINSFEHYMIFNKISEYAIFIDSINMDYYELIGGSQGKSCEFYDGHLDEIDLKSIIKTAVREKDYECVRIEDLVRYGQVLAFTNTLGRFEFSCLDFEKFIDKLIDSHKHEFFKVDL